MKRKAALALVCLLMLALAGCSKGSTTINDPDGANFAPESTLAPVSDSVRPSATQPEVLDLPIELADDPTDDPEIPMEDPGESGAEATPEPPLDPTPTSSVDLSTYRFQQLTDTSFGFTFEYPTHWVNLPGKYTVCFREPVEEDDFPARVTVTKKALVHTPKAEKVLAQFQSFAQTIYAQYDPSTFELGELNTSARFMGQSAYEITYLAYSGDVEIKGYMICCAVDKSIYVYHFCASYPDYTAMESMMGRMRDSVAVVK